MVTGGTLPPGMTLASNGQLSGIPASAGVYNGITVAATNAYGSASQTFSIVVNPASLTIKANDASKLQGDPNPPFSASPLGLVNGDTLESLSGTLTFTTLATQASPAGAYPITPGGLSSPNYTIAFVDGTLTVSDRSLFTIYLPVARR